MLQTAIKFPPIHVRHLSPSFQQNGQPKIKFVNPNSGNFDRNIRYAAEQPYRMIQHKELLGKNIVVAGSGPSLADPNVITKIKELQAEGYLLCALKKALRVLHDQGLKIDYSVSMDPGAHICKPQRITKIPGVTYILATSSDVLLFDYLSADTSYLTWLAGQTEEDSKRILDDYYDQYMKGESLFNNLPECGAVDILKFHSACGLPNEIQLYEELFALRSGIEADAWVAGGGFNVTNRAASAFLFMGVNKMVFAGADGGWRKGESFYADGLPNRPGVDMCDEGKVDGTPWWTRPDMLASSVALTRMARSVGADRISFIGDVMPLKLLDKDEEFLKNCVSFQK